ncbi:MAG: PQQ-dependent sugar dehydrogenase [Planctomycetes bacterium]|nr:PQQ-dependent sugar dehydrogenase [Planctomycetota bacterium]
MRSLVSLLASCLLLVSVAAQTPLRLDFVVGGLTRPLLVTAPPGDTERIFIVEQPGRIRIVKNGVLLATPFLDLTTSGIVSYGGENGLLGLAFHPQYATNGRFFVFHSGWPWPTEHVRRFTVSAGNPDLADPSSGVGLLQVPSVYGHHNGGMVAFGADGFLYVSLGDGGSTAPLWPNDPQNHAQRGDSLLGKVLRLDVDTVQPPLQYGVPPGNPFVGPGDPRDEIWAFGFRNPYRFSFDRLTGDLWLADVGGNREEIDFEAAGSAGGGNYGWSCMSGTFCTGTASCVCNAANLRLPIHEYPVAPNGQAIIGGFVYRGVAIPDLRGSYFFADHIRVELWSCRRLGTGVSQLTNRTVELSPPSPHFLVGPTGFGEDGFGEIYLCDLSGKVFKIVPTTPVQAGVVPFGVGTPGCSGAHTLAAVGSPVIGNPRFELVCTQAPPLFPGLLGFAGMADVPGSDPLGFGVLLHLGLASPFLVLETMLSDAAGVGSFPFAIPPAPALVGAVLHTQVLWPWSPAVCTPSSSGWSSSPGLTLTLQP